MDLQCSDKYALLQSSHVNRIPQDSINESVIWKQPVSNSNLRSCMRNEQGIFDDNFSVFGLIGKSLNWENCFEAKWFESRFKKTELVEIL